MNKVVLKARALWHVLRPLFLGLVPSFAGYLDCHLCVAARTVTPNPPTTS